MMADYDHMGLAVPKMDDDAPADMSTVCSDTDVTKALTLTTMVAVTAMGTTLTSKPSYNLWHNYEYKCRQQQMYWGHSRPKNYFKTGRFTVAC